MHCKVFAGVNILYHETSEAGNTTVIFVVFIYLQKFDSFNKNCIVCRPAPIILSRISPHYSFDHYLLFS